VGAHQIAREMRADLFDIECDFYLAGPPDFVDALADDRAPPGAVGACRWGLDDGQRTDGAPHDGATAAAQTLRCASSASAWPEFDGEIIVIEPEGLPATVAFVLAARWRVDLPPARAMAAKAARARPPGLTGAARSRAVRSCHPVALPGRRRSQTLSERFPHALFRY
jgi:hypothetical protein